MLNDSFTYTHSEIATFLTCPRKYDYAYRDKLELKRLHFPFVIGQAWHEGITTLYKTKNVVMAIDVALKSLKSSRAMISKEMFIQEKDEIEFIRSETIITSSIDRYFKVYEKTINKFNIIHADEIFTSSLIGDICISGHPDMILKQINTNKIYIYELKSSSYITKEMIDRYYFDFQTSFYFLLMMSIYDISGIYFDAIKKPSLRLGKAESEASFINRLDNFYTASSEDELFYQDSYKRNTSQLDETINVIKYAIYNIDNLNVSVPSIYPMNRMRCYDFSSTCEYLPLCNYGKTPLTLKSYKIKERDR